jgi:flagellar biosynthesis/type III secretory pathway protein FliH
MKTMQETAEAEKIERLRKDLAPLLDVLYDMRYEEGFDTGYDKGKDEGALGEKIRIALAMLGDGMSVEQTAKWTGLPPAQVAALRTGNGHNAKEQ